MFKEKLHNDIDKITPSAELLDRVSLMMKEEASKEKPKIYMTAAKYGSLAAAVCIVTAVAVMLGTTANKDTAPRTGNLSADYNEAVSDMNMMSFRAETEAGTEARSGKNSLALQRVRVCVRRGGTPAGFCMPAVQAPGFRF